VSNSRICEDDLQQGFQRSFVRRVSHLKIHITSSIALIFTFIISLHVETARQEREWKRERAGRGSGHGGVGY